MAFPDFIAGGAQKSGTTSLFYILKKHPQILLPDEEEANFFDVDENFNQGETYYDHLYSESTTNNQLRGDFSVNYLFFDFVPQRIFETLGNEVKLLFILRNPVDRAYSQYQMNIRNYIEDLDFESALKKEEERLQSKSLLQRIRYSYTSRGLYAAQLNRYFHYFPPENIKPILFEELYGPDKENVIKNIQEFLNVDIVELDTNLQKFKSGVTRFPVLAPLLSANNKKLAAIRNRLPLPPFLRKMLRKALLKEPERLSQEQKEQVFHQYFQSDSEELKKLIQKDVIDYWGFNS